MQGEMERMTEKGVMGVGEESGMGGWGDNSEAETNL